MIAAKRETLAAKDRVKPVFIIILPSLIDCEIAQRACVAKVRRDAYRWLWRCSASLQVPAISEFALRAVQIFASNATLIGVAIGF